MGRLDFERQRNEMSAKDWHDTMAYPPVEGGAECVGEPFSILTAHIGELRPNTTINFWTFGRYAMHHVLRYVLSQTGPADVVACTWAISTRAVDDLLMLRDKGLLRSFKLWIDPRVKVRNPEPLQMLKLYWPVAIAPVHAKVTTIINEKWKVSIYGSLNFTTNPQPERGAICTVPSVVAVDNKILEEAFNEGTN